MLVLMLTKRNERLTRLAAEIEKQRETPKFDAAPEYSQELIPRDAAGKALSWTEPRRVDDTSLFLRMRGFQGMGGACSVPLC